MSNTPNRYRTPTGAASYPHLFKAVAAEEGGKPKYAITIVLSEEAQQTDEFKAMKQAAFSLGVERFGKDFESKVLSGALHWPFKKDGAGGTTPKYPQIPNAVVMAFRSDAPPGVVSRVPISVTDNRPKPITEADQKPGNPDEIYPGALVRAVVSLFAFDRGVKKGISFGLNNVQKMGEGVRLDSRKAASDDFDADLTQPPPADLSTGVPAAAGAGSSIL